MKKVTVMMTNGIIKNMDARYARALVLCKKAIYLNNYEQKVVPNGAYLNKSEPQPAPTNPVTPEEESVLEHQEEETFVEEESVLEHQEEETFVEEQPENDDLTALRKEYSDKFDKKCYHGWTAEEIKAKIQAG